MYRGCGVGTISAVAPLRVAPAAPHQPALTAAPPARGALVVMAHFVYAGRVGGAEHMLYNLLHGFAATDPRVAIAGGFRNERRTLS
jgi:hypothetical protein